MPGFSSFYPMLESRFHIGQIFFRTDANECMVLGRQLLKYSLVMNGKIRGKVLDSNFFNPIWPPGSNSIVDPNKSKWIRSKTGWDNLLPFISVGRFF